MSDENYYKLINILKSIPVLNVPFSAGLALGALCQNDTEMVKRTGELDPILIFNPLKCLSNLSKFIVSFFRDYNEGIWIGKKAYGNQIFGFTLSPGFDLYQYAILIDGNMYTLRSTNSYKVEVKITKDQQQIQLYTWFPCSKQNQRLNATLKEYAKSLETFNYSYLPLGSNQINSQLFTNLMLAYAAKISPTKAAVEMTSSVGTFLI
ncbi:unnamed protein product [Brachionus calyciflorus]|uniref:Uncharacterized protein n=1 Tax=Brachionus calyciflorus TaxID=104777 RepID=A0A813MNZ1_9BILA|nr:unnamed protein product [Brachionus calyciflorus]